MTDETPNTQMHRHQPWESVLARLEAYVDAHGGIPVPDFGPNVSEEATLGRWLDSQRRQSTSGQLANDRQRLLDERVPGWNEIGHRRWLGELDAVVAYRAEHGAWPRQGNSRAPDETSLGRWLWFQRRLHKSGNLSEERRQLLDERAPGWDIPRRTV